MGKSVRNKCVVFSGTAGGNLFAAVDRQHAEIKISPVWTGGRLLLPTSKSCDTETRTKIKKIWPQ